MIISFAPPKQPPQRFETETGSVLIGRCPGSLKPVDIDLVSDDYVSRHHARISCEQDRYWVEDLGSMNGTWVNGVCIEKKTAIRPGDMVQIGYTVFVVQSQQSPPPADDGTVFDPRLAAMRDRQAADLVEPEAKPPAATTAAPPPQDKTMARVPDTVRDEAVKGGQGGEPRIRATPALPEEATAIHTEIHAVLPAQPAAEPSAPKPVTAKAACCPAAASRGQSKPMPPPLEALTTVRPAAATADQATDFRFDESGPSGPEVQDGPTSLSAPITGPAFEKTTVRPAAPPAQQPYGQRPEAAAPSAMLSQLEAFSGLSEKLAVAESLDGFVQLLVQELPRAIPNALRGAILLPDERGELLLKAHWPLGDHPMSNTLVQQAFETRQGLIWKVDATQACAFGQPESIVYAKVMAALCVPVIMADRVLGVIYVDNNLTRDAFDPGDLELMRAVAAQMVAFFKYQQLNRQRQQDQGLRSSLARQFSPKILNYMMGKGGQWHTGGKKVDPVTILISDVRGFTALSRTMHPEEAVRMLNEMFDAFVPIVFEYDGVVDKFVGDCLLAVFGSPEPDNNQWEKAVKAALEMQKAVRMLNEGRRVRRLPGFEVGIGIHTGEVIHGFIGSTERTEFTVIGDTVNVASRYCDGAEAGEMLISQAVFERVFRLVEVRPRTIKTKHADREPDLKGYTVFGLKDRVVKPA